MSAPVRIRLRFAKRGPLRLISHHDLMRVLERLIRRAEIPIAHTQGYSPRPRITFAMPLGLGIEGQREVVDFELEPGHGAEELTALLNQHSPEGLVWLEAEMLAPGTSAPAVIAARYALAVAAAHEPQAQSALAGFLAAAAWPFEQQRPGRTRMIDLRAAVLDATLEPGLLRFTLEVTRDGSARPEEVVQALGLSPLFEQGAYLVREDVVLAHKAPNLPPRSHRGETGAGSSASLPPGAEAAQSPVSEPVVLINQST